jgi:hypothetical protein
MSYPSHPSWESCPWCRPGILVPFRLSQLQPVRPIPMPCVTTTIQVGLLTLSQEAEMGAGCGTPIRGPWAGLETCELPPDGGASAVAVLWPRSGAALAGESRAVRPGAGASRAHHGPSGACAGKAAPWRWSRPRGRWPREIKWGCWLGDPAATAEVSGRHTRAADCNKRGINLSS